MWSQLALKINSRPQKVLPNYKSRICIQLHWVFLLNTWLSTRCIITSMVCLWFRRVSNWLAAWWRHCLSVQSALAAFNAPHSYRSCCTFNAPRDQRGPPSSGEFQHTACVTANGKQNLVCSWVFNLKPNWNEHRVCSEYELMSSWKQWEFWWDCCHQAPHCLMIDEKSQQNIILYGVGHLALNQSQSPCLLTYLWLVTRHLLFAPIAHVCYDVTLCKAC